MAAHPRGPTVDDADLVVFVAKDKHGNLQEVHALRADMMLASPVFRKMLSEEWNYNGGKVMFENFEFETLRLVVEFVQNFDIVTEVDLPNLLELIKMADYLLMKPLVKLCSKSLSSLMKVENTWTVLNVVLKFENPDCALKAYGKILASKTFECLNHHTFASASFESIVFLLNQDTLNLQNESQLVSFCWKWAKLQQSPMKAMTDLLPHLKLEKSLDEGFGQLLSIMMDPALVFAKGARKFIPVASAAAACLKNMDNVQLISLDPDISTRHYDISKNNRQVFSKVYLEPTENNIVLFGILLPLLVAPAASGWKYEQLGHKFNFSSQQRACKYKLKLWTNSSDILLADVEGTTQMGFSNGLTKKEELVGNAIIFDEAPLLIIGQIVVLTVELELSKLVTLPTFKMHSPQTKQLRVWQDFHYIHKNPVATPSFISGFVVHK